jgi:zinc protease
MQSVIFAGHLAPPKANPDEVAIEALNTVLGGAFTSRVNMNLREDKHWSYGAQTAIPDARGQRMFVTIAPVQTDKTKESVAEVAKELRGIRAERPVTADELTQARNTQTLTLPGEWETMNAVAASLSNIVRFGLPDTHYDTYADRVSALTVRDLGTVAPKLVQPDHVVWVVVGDRAKIEAGIRELNLGDIRYIDADGKVLPAGSAGTP